MKTKFFSPSVRVSCISLALCMIPLSAQAARVNATLSWESGDYGTTYNYAGPRLDMSINPDGSNWYYTLGYRNRTHETNQNYTRTEGQAAYRFRYAEGWIQPHLNIRQDVTSFESNSRTKVDHYKAGVTYIHDIADSWSLWGVLKGGIERQSDTNASQGITRESDYLQWELEPGIRYSFTPNSRVTASYYNNGVRSDKGETWGLSDDKSSEQVRLYYFYRADNGFTFSPYIRQAIGWGNQHTWYESAALDGTVALNKVSRYALQMSYPIFDSVSLTAEYYIEDVEYKENFDLGKDDLRVKYLKLGVRASF